MKTIVDIGGHYVPVRNAAAATAIIRALSDAIVCDSGLVGSQSVWFPTKWEHKRDPTIKNVSDDQILPYDPTEPPPARETIDVHVSPSRPFRRRINGHHKQLLLGNP